MSAEMPVAGNSPPPMSKRSDFRLAHATIRPALRTIVGPHARVMVEPRVMQVLLALCDANGAVLSREDLMQICWAGTIVGDDSINRAIAEVRRAERATGAGFRIETIPRIGYRLVGQVADDVAAVPVLPESTRQSSLSRRAAIAGGVAVVGAAALGGWAILRRRSDARVAEMIESGRQDMRFGTPEAVASAAATFRKAVEMEPDSATGWGWLAIALQRSIDSAAGDRRSAVNQCEQAATRALSLDAAEPNARAALLLLRQSPDDWVGFERNLRDLLRDAPDNLITLESLTYFLQGVGRCRESRDVNDQAVRAEPLSPTFQNRRAMKYWIFGQVGEADRVINRASALWPDHPDVWNARLLIYAFTQRPKAALALIEDSETRPASLTLPAIEAWRTWLAALDYPAPATLEAARAKGLSAAAMAPGLAANAIMVLSALNLVDDAYVIAEGLLLQRGNIVGKPVSTRGKAFYEDANWRETQWLFTPATSSFRQDSRFERFCESIGYMRYWKTRGVFPDPFMRGSLPSAE